MAYLKDSPLEGLRGTLGDIVFRTWNGKTYVYPKSTKPRKQSAAQKKNRDKFRVASLGAKQLLEDPALQAHYYHQALVLKLPNAYTAALQDVMKKLK